MMYDVAIVGAGVVGALIARELSRYNVKVCLIDKEADVAMGTSKANSAIVHAGYDAKPGSLKARLNVRGNALMSQVAEELDVPFQRIGSLVLAFHEEDMTQLHKLYSRGIENQVPDLKILDKEQVRKMEPNLSEEVIAALYAPTAGIICPYELTVGAVENAVFNGVDLKLERTVINIIAEHRQFTLITEKEEIQCKYLINAAGVHADAIAAMVGKENFSITPRKGEYLLLDKSQGGVVNTVIFQPPSKMGKGILVTPTVDGNLLIGPNAHDIDNKEDISTTASGLEEVIHGAGKSVPTLDIRQVITSFAGLRATPSTGDFIIEEAADVKGFIQVAGIESPGLSASPAIAEYVVKVLNQAGLELEKREKFDPIRKPVVRFREMTDAERAKVIQQNSKYGKIICRCEKVTEGEIVDCIRRPAGARNIDAVKRRTRAGMGRCQGGFCAPRVAEILSRELDIPMEEVTKMGGQSKLLAGRTK